MSRPTNWTYFTHRGNEYRAAFWNETEEGILVQRLGWVDEASTTNISRVGRLNEQPEFQDLIFAGWDAINDGRMETSASEPE